MKFCLESFDLLICDIKKVTTPINELYFQSENKKLNSLTIFNRLRQLYTILTINHKTEFNMSTFDSLIAPIQ